MRVNNFLLLNSFYHRDAIFIKVCLLYQSMYSSAQQIYPHIYNVIDVPLIYLVNLFSAFHIIIHNYLMGTYRFTSMLLCRFLHIFLALLYRHQKRPHLFVIAYLLLCQFIRNNEPIILCMI